MSDRPVPVTAEINENKDDGFTDLDKLLPSDEIGTESTGHSSPYFREGNKSGAYKRKRSGAKAGGGEKKLVKKGKWFGKKNAYSSNKSSGSSFKKTSTPNKGGQSSSKGLLPPPRPRTAKKD